jgi:hypothetical protein
MNGEIFRRCSFLIAAGLIFTVQLARADHGTLVSGTYQVIQKTDLGARTRLRLRLHLTNHGRSDLYIQRITFWDFSHPVKGGTQACSIVLRARASADTTEEFMVPHPEYELWRRGTQPRLILEIQTPGGQSTTHAVRLDRARRGKAE